MAHDDAGETRVGGGLSDAKKKTAHEERGESAGEAGEKSGRGPNRETDGEDFFRWKTIGEPAGKNQEGRVRPEKSGEKNTELRRRNGKFAFESWSGNGERAAVNVGDEEGEKKENENGPKDGREFSGCGGWVQGERIV
jgi:hypothetical protein